MSKNKVRPRWVRMRYVEFKDDRDIIRGILDRKAWPYKCGNSIRWKPLATSKKDFGY